MKTKYIILSILAVFALIGCKQGGVLEEADFNVVLDASNTYIAGKPVKFNIDGNVDNLVLYTGEAGSKYEYKDRYTVTKDQVKSVSLKLDIRSQYGPAGGLTVYISNKFDGLSGKDAAADKAKIAEMVKGGMAGWKEMKFNEINGKWSTNIQNVDDCLDNFAVALHWNPVDGGKSTQRTYSVNGYIEMEVEGSEPTKLAITNLGLVSVMMNDEISDPYKTNAGNGSIIFNQPNNAQIIFKGVPANKLKYSLDGWVISSPSPLNKVPNDKPKVIKNLQNYMKDFEYTYSKPGTYKVTFVGTNSNYQGASRKVQEMTINIVDKSI